MEKYDTARQAMDDNTEHALCVLDDKGYRDTLRICNTSCFCPATTTRTRVVVTFIRVLLVFFSLSLFSVSVSLFRSVSLHVRSTYFLSLVLVNTWREQHEEEAIAYIYPCTCRDSNKKKKTLHALDRYIS